MLPLSLAQGPELLYEGYMNKGDYLLVGPVTILLKDVVYDINDGKWKAVFIAFNEDMEPIGPNLTLIYVPDPEKVQELLQNQTFLRAMAETLGYNPDNPIEYAEFLRWLSTASQMEIWDAIVKTIEEHPELGIKLDDLEKAYYVPNARPIGVNETAKVEYRGKTLYITVLQAYPNGVRVSISGPIQWRVSMVQGLLLSKIDIKGPVKPGQYFSVNVHLRNIGSRKVRFVTVVLSPTPVVPNVGKSETTEENVASIVPQILTQTGTIQGTLYPAESSMKFIEFIEPGEDKVVKFLYKVNENAKPGDYPLYLTVIYFTYKLGGGGNLEQRVLYDTAVVTVSKDYEANFIIIQEVPKVVHPGDDFNIKVRFKNVGADTAKDIKGELVLEELTGKVFTPRSPSNFYVKFVDPGMEFNETFKLHVEESAKTGTYVFKVRIRYHSGDSNKEITQEFTFSTTVLRRRTAFIEIENVTMSPERIEPGTTFQLTLTLRNVGESYAKGLEVRIIPTMTLVRREIKKVDLSQLSNLPIPGGEELAKNLQTALNQMIGQIAEEQVPAFLPIGEDNVKYDGMILPNQTIKVKFILKANDRLENNVYPLKIELRYLSSPNDEQITDERVVGIDVTGMERLVVTSISTSPSRVLPGTSNVEISFTIENVGDGKADYIIVTPNPRPPFKLSETSTQIINIGSLGKGDSARASFKVDVDENAKAGKYAIPLIIQYRDPTGNFRNITINIPIIIAEKPKLIITNVRFGSEPLQGKDVNVYITVKNIGGEQAESVVIEGVVRSSQPFTLIKRTDYIGTLDPGQSGEGVITLSIDKDAVPKTYNVLIRIRAVGDKEKGDDNVYIFEGTIKVPVKENIKTRERLKLLAIIAGILAAIIIVITYIKRRK
ncbi:COG1361 S-layer family protein [Pyrococcus sp. NA2]|uniref:COG1361 S-layer family protein n=1 Tax=Pyrococcus sp. (strain NA2) TaxID=342949 RepID=UPI00064FE894